MDLNNKLKSAGLTNNESKLYLALLELGPSNAGILSRKTGLHRRVVYDTTEMLIKKGMIGYIIENGKRLFQASEPSRILDLIKEKEEEINEAMPDLMSLFSKAKKSEGTFFYKGKNGLKSVFEDQIKEGKEILILGASDLAYEVLQYYFKWFDKRRVEKKIKTKIVFNRTKKKLNIPLSEIRFLPEKYSSPLAVNIYGDKVVIILWSKDNPLAILIKNNEISEGYRKQFEWMWNVAKK